MSVIDLQHLQTMLGRLDEFIQDAVIRAEMAGQDPTDALRGFVIKPEDVARDLEQPALTSLWTERGEMNWSLKIASGREIAAPAKEAPKSVWIGSRPPVPQRAT